MAFRSLPVRQETPLSARRPAETPAAGDVPPTARHPGHIAGTLRPTARFTPFMHAGARRPRPHRAVTALSRESHRSRVNKSGQYDSARPANPSTGIRPAGTRGAGRSHPLNYPSTASAIPFREAIGVDRKCGGSGRGTESRTGIHSSPPHITKCRLMNKDTTIRPGAGTPVTPDRPARPPRPFTPSVLLQGTRVGGRDTQIRSVQHEIHHSGT